MRAWTLAIALAAVPGTMIAQDVPLTFGSGYEAGLSVADEAWSYSDDIFAGIGMGALTGMLDVWGQDRDGATTRSLYRNGLVLSGVAFALSLVFAEVRTGPPSALLTRQPPDLEYRSGFVAGYSARRASRNRTGAAISTVTFLATNALVIALAADNDGTGYPLFSAQVPVN